MNALRKFLAITNDVPCATEDCAVILDRNTASADISCLNLKRGGLAVCITVYNEAADALHNSLLGLADSIALLQASSSEIVVNVCILVDGIQKCSPSMKETLQRLIGYEKPAFPSGHDFTCYYRRADLFDLSVFSECITENSNDVRGWKAASSPTQALGLSMQLPHERRCTVHLLVGIKNENYGKLDSHWWFYRIFCPELMPDYCFQMDVGTVPSLRSFHEMVEAFRGNPAIGAVASGILPPQPSAVWSLLECWQYMSFVSTVLVDWPIEEFAGYLSVIPGQLSAIRWEALVPPHTSTGEGEISKPLDAYFKGLGPLTPYESMLYLAEDRVLCREIVSNPKNKWIVSHVDNALAVTDQCGSWDELLRQRKRWCNGYIACRVSFICHISRFIRNPAVASTRKLRAITAAGYHMAVLTYDWFTLGFFLLYAFSLFQQAAMLTGQILVIPSAFNAFKYVFPFSLLAQLTVCLRGVLDARAIRIIRILIILQSSVIAAALSVNALYGRSVLLPALLVFLFIVAPASSIIGYRRYAGAILIAMPIAFLNMYVVSVLMWMYAICNAHDSSWGTKGLTGIARKKTDACDAPSFHAKEFLRFRSVYVSAWIISNVILAYLVASWCQSKKCNGAMFPLAITSAFAFTGLVCRVYKKLRGKSRPTRRNAKSSSTWRHELR